MKNNLGIITTTMTGYMLSLASIAHAQPSSEDLLGGVSGWANGGSNAEDLVITILNYALGIAGLIAVVFLIMGGFQYVTAGGNEETTKKATKTIINSVIGLVIIFAAYAIEQTVIGAIGAGQ